MVYVRTRVLSDHEKSNFSLNEIGNKLVRLTTKPEFFLPSRNILRARRGKPSKLVRSVPMQNMRKIIIITTAKQEEEEEEEYVVVSEWKHSS